MIAKFHYGSWHILAFSDCSALIDLKVERSFVLLPTPALETEIGSS